MLSTALYSLKSHEEQYAIFDFYANKFFIEAVNGIRSAYSVTIHGSLMTLTALLQQHKGISTRNPELRNTVLEALLAKLLHHKDQSIRFASIELMSFMCEFDNGPSSDVFTVKWMHYLIETLKKDKDRFNCLAALEKTLGSLNADDIFQHLDALVKIFKGILQLKGRYRDVADSSKVVRCVAILTDKFGLRFKRQLLMLVPLMMACGIWLELLNGLQVICLHWPDAFYIFEDQLMAHVKHLLSSTEVNGVLLALDALPLFNFTESILTASTGKFIVDNLFVHENASIRAQSTSTILKICLRALNCDDQPDWIIVGYMSSVLTRMVADETDTVSALILNVLDTSHDFDRILVHIECLRPLFIFLGSNNVALARRCQAASLLGRVVSSNVAVILPQYRKLLLQYLSEIQCIQPHTLLRREDSAKLLFEVLQWPDKLALPYVPALLKNVVQKIDDDEIEFAVSMLACLGRLMEISPKDCESSLPAILCRLQKLIQDQSSSFRRRAALSCITTILRRSDRRLIDRDMFCSLLTDTIGILKIDLDPVVRKEAMRLAGEIGAIDPFLMKTKELSQPISLEDDGSAGTAANLANQSSLSTSPEDFFAWTVVNALARIVKDVSLSIHHMAAMQALVQLFRNHGQRASAFLPLIMPVVIPLIQNCSSSMVEVYVQQLAFIASVVGIHIRAYMSDILELILGIWAKYAASYASILQLNDVLVNCLKGEFREHIPMVLPLILQVLEIDANSIAVHPATIQRALRSIAVLGPQLSDYAGIIGDTLVILLRQSQYFRDVRITTLRTTASICKDIPAVADNPAVLQSLISIVEASADQPTLEHCMDAIVVVAISQGKDFFRFLPQLAKTVFSRNIKHDTFERLLSANLNSPAKLADIATESIRELEAKIGGLNLTTDVSSSLPWYERANLTETAMKRMWDISICLNRDDWFDWIRRLGHEFMRASSSPALRSCTTLASIYYPLSKELFNAASASCIGEMSVEGLDDFIASIELALASPTIPSEILQMLLNLAEFMERQEKPLPIDIRLLGTYATRCHAFAKALYYKEQEFNSSEWRARPDAAVVEQLISINSQTQQPDAALGILAAANKQFKIILKESWYEKLQRWEEAMHAYETKFKADPTSFESMFGILRCRHALGEWDELEGLVSEAWAGLDSAGKGVVAPIACASAWGLRSWERLAEYSRALNPKSVDTPFFQTILAVKDEDWAKARDLITVTRDLVDAELTALLSESYNRAYR